MYGFWSLDDARQVCPDTHGIEDEDLHTTWETTLHTTWETTLHTIRTKATTHRITDDDDDDDDDDDGDDDDDVFFSVIATNSMSRHILLQTRADD